VTRASTSSAAWSRGRASSSPTRRRRARDRRDPLTLGEARRLFAVAGEMPAEQAAQIAAHLTDLEIAETLTRYDRFDPVQQLKAGAEFYVMYRQGKRPHGRNAVRDFWGGIVLHVEASEKPDLALLEEALATFEKRFAGDRGYQEFVDKHRQALVELQRKASALEPNKPR
jgi:hypothetical protein